LIAGVAAEIIFLGYNVYYNGGKPIDEKWSVEIKVDKDSILKGKSVTVYFNPADSSNNNNNGSKEKSSR
jgi:hypothetical protein